MMLLSKDFGCTVETYIDVSYLEQLILEKKVGRGGEKRREEEEELEREGGHILCTYSLHKRTQHKVVCRMYGEYLSKIITYNLHTTCR